MAEEDSPSSGNMNNQSISMFYRTLCRLDLKYLVELLEQFLCLLGGNEFLGLFRHLGGQLDTGLVTLNIAAYLVNIASRHQGIRSGCQVIT